MGLIRGLKVRGWVQCNYDWLDEVKADPYELHSLEPWPVLEADFCRSFVDYAEQEKAHNELQRLKMSPRDVDGYISQFQMLGHSAHMDLNDPTALCLFVRGLPNSLADACIDRESPDSFEQWAKAAQRQHRNFLRKQAIHKDYGSACPPPPPQGRWAGLFQNRNQGRAPASQLPC